MGVDVDALALRLLEQKIQIAQVVPQDQDDLPLPMRGRKMLKIADYLSEGTARTLLMPLCCCGTASRLNPEGGIYDARAAEVLRQVDYDFTRLRQASIEY